MLADEIAECREHDADEEEDNTTEVEADVLAVMDVLPDSQPT